MKGFILYPTYRASNDGSYVWLFGRLENGQSFLSMNKYEPYFYIKEKDSKSLFKKASPKEYNVEKTNFKNFKNEKVSRIILEQPKEVSILRRELEEKGIECYEADIRFAYRYLIDKEIMMSIDIDGEYENGEFVDRIYYDATIIPCNFFPKLKIFSIDIETSKNSEKLYSIAIYSKGFEKVLIGDEEDMLEEFKKIIIEEDPDIITGWNLIDFDLMVLKNKFKEHNIPFNLGRVNESCKIKLESNFFRDSKADFPGRIVLDGINLLRMNFVKLNSFKLDNVAKSILNKKKLIDFTNKGEEIERLFNEDKEKLKEYNLHDAKLVYEILEKIKAIEMVIEKSILTGMPLDRVNASIASLDSLYLRELKKKGFVAPSGSYSVKEERIKGGYVMESKPGIYDNVLVLDFKSLYPSMMQTFNIDPLNYVEDCKGKDLIIAPNGACFKNNEGIIGNIIERLLIARDKSKKEGNELQRWAIKILLNCFSEDTDILTKNGLKKVKDVKVGEEVYSINPKTKNIEFNKVVKTFKYKYNGEMISIKSNNIDFLVTPNHRFLIKKRDGYNWFEAKDLLEKATKDFWLPKHTPIKGKKVEYISLEKKCKQYNISYILKENKLQKKKKHSSIPIIYNLKDWLEFLGWYLSEGCIYISKSKKYPNGNHRGICHKITLCQWNKEKRIEIIKLLERMGLKYSIDSNGINVSNQIIAEILSKECYEGSDKKRIPPYIFELDHSLLKYLFKTIMMGDGDSNGERYSTKHQFLAEDVMRLVHHLGYYGFVYEDKQIYSGKEYTMYRVQINRTRGVQPYISKYRNIKKMDYQGYVYCVEVTPNHTVLAGRGTKLNFCGQSFFGVLANPNCRFFNLNIANAITHFGQSLIKLTAKKISEEGYEVIYSDTDSCFVLSKAKNLEEAEKIGRELNKKLNNFFKEFVKKEYNRESKLILEYEKCFTRFLMPKIRGGEEGAKKRYAGISNGKIEIVGLEAIRGDWTELAKKFQIELLEMVFNKKEVKGYIKKFVIDIKKGKYDELLVYRKSLRKGLEEYRLITPPHVKAARKLNNFQGNVIEYLMTEDGPEPIENLKNKIDYKHYIDKQIKPIADSVLNFFDLNFDELIEGSKQMNLSSYS